MTATLLPNAKQQFSDSNGRPLAGGSVYFYIPNTSTFKSTWQDAGETILNTNPVILDSNGQAIIYGDGQYRQVVYDVHGNVIWDRLTDSPALNSEFQSFKSGIISSIGSSLIGFIQAGVGAVKMTLQDLLREWVTPQQFGAKADGITDDVVAIESALATGKAVDFGDSTKTYFVSRAPQYTGRVNVRAKGATIKSDAKHLHITDGSGSRVSGLNIMPATTPYTITRDHNTWTASSVAQSVQGYMPTSQDADIWSGLPDYVKAQFDNFDPRGIYFDVSSAAGGSDVEISGITGYQVTITLYGYSDSTVRDCNIGGRREGVYFYNALGAPNGAFTLPRGVNNSVINCRVKYASQCGIIFFGNDQLKVNDVWSHDNGESGVKTYQHDPSTPTSVMCTDGVFTNVHTFYNYYDGLDATNVNGIDFPSTYESRHTLGDCYSFFNRHTGITICGQKNKVSGCNVQNNGSHGINGQGAYSSFTGNYAAYNAAHPEIHPFQIFDMAIQGDALASVGNEIYNPNAPSTYNYIHTGAFGANPTATLEGIDSGNVCSHGVTRMLLSPTIPTEMTPSMFGAGTRALTNNAQAVFRQGGAGSDIGGSANIGYVRIRGDSAASANLDFTPNSVDPAGSPGFAGRLLYDFTNNLFRLAVNGAAQSVYLQSGVGFFPSPDNVLSLGAAGLRWTQLYAASSTINTSDGREKQQVKDIEQAALRAVRSVKLVQFKFTDAVEKKGDGARWHFGVIAQQVKEAFEAEGLDAFSYGLLCYDEWPETPEVRDENGDVIEPARPAGNRYGVRYEELYALKMAVMESPPN